MSPQEPSAIVPSSSLLWVRWLVRGLGAHAAPEAKIDRPERRSASRKEAHEDARRPAPAVRPSSTASRSAAPRSRARRRRVDVKKRQDDVKPVNPDELKKYAERDTRKTRLQARARALLITEIQGLERLFKTHAEELAGSPAAHAAPRRSATSSSSRAAFRDKIAGRHQGATTPRRRTRSGAPAAVPGRRSPGREDREGRAQEGDRVLHAHEERATRTTRRSTRSSTTSRTSTSRRSDLDNARKVYFELIQKAPKSPYIPNAYLAFGELFFNEAQGDPSKWELAAQRVQGGDQVPAAEQQGVRLRPLQARLRLLEQGRVRRARSTSSRRSIEYGDQFTRACRTPTQLAKSARRDIIPVYARERRTRSKAYNFFKPLSRRQGRRDDKTFKMMNDLGYRPTSTPVTTTKASSSTRT